MSNAPAAPDRPGDRDQQQAAEVLWGMSSDPGVMLPADERKLARVAAALATARAEEAARWRAKIEALRTVLTRDCWLDGYGREVVSTDRLRAVLDGEQR